jgi:hypothetical protein
MCPVALFGTVLSRSDGPENPLRPKPKGKALLVGCRTQTGHAGSMLQIRDFAKPDSLPMQDEPEGLGMLEIEHQRARGREVKLGSDWPVRRGQRGNPV